MGAGGPRTGRHKTINLETFERLESEVRAYIRAWPTVFRTARGHELIAEDGRTYIDFFAGAGTLNYGHNHPRLKQTLIDYVQADGVVHGLDMATVAKRAFLERFDAVVLRPRGLDYKLQFPGPTGANAVEAALKLARKVTGRRTIVGFSNAFHGMSLGALAVTASAMKRRGAGVPLPDAVFMPYDGALPGGADTIDPLAAHLRATAGSPDLPAAVIVETVQGEGGVNVASLDWLRRLAALCRAQDVLLIVDDIQAGCGRTGPFFSFEPAGITPDIVCLSKSLSGLGLPLALVLMRRELDVWAPGEHSGTFRGNNAAFVTATEALSFWEDDALPRAVEQKAAVVHAALRGFAAACPAHFGEARGRGLLRGLPCTDPAHGAAISRAAFARGLIIETSGPQDEVVKVIPPLTIPDDALRAGLRILAESIDAVLGGARAVHSLAAAAPAPGAPPP